MSQHNHERQIEREKQHYANGEITLDEFEKRVYDILHPNRKPPLSSFRDPATRKLEALERGEY